MHRAPKLEPSFWMSPRSWMPLVHAMDRLMRHVGVVASTLLVLLGVGCAAPIAPVNDVVHDAEVRDCALDAWRGTAPLDVAILIDTSQSTARPTGFDIDGDGTVRPFARNPALDRGDSRLAAQVAALRPLLRHYTDGAGGDVRFSIVTYSGPSTEHTVGRTQLAASRRDSQEVVPLTSDRARLDRALDRLLAEGSDGKTIFYAGMRRAMRALVAKPIPEDRRRRRIVLLLSDTGSPNGLAQDGKFMSVDWRMKHAAVNAREQEIVFHTFGLSPEAAEWRHAPLGQIAGATGGTYHPVEDPFQLACHLARSLRPPERFVRRERAFAAQPVDARPAEGKRASSTKIADRR